MDDRSQLIGKRIQKKEERVKKNFLRYINVSYRDFFIGTLTTKGE